MAQALPIIAGVQAFGALAGGFSKAQALKSQAADVRNTAQFNVQLEAEEELRRQKKLAADLRLASGEQQVAAATSGFSSSSKSFLAVMNETVDSFTNSMRQSLGDSKLRQSEIVRSAEQEAKSLRRRAKAAKVEGISSAVGIGGRSLLGG